MFTQCSKFPLLFSPGVPILLTPITGNSVIVMNLASGDCILQNTPGIRRPVWYA